MKDKRYLEWIRTQPCIVCFRPAEAHHAGERGLGQKCPDREAIPLCPGHHRRDGWPDSAHRLGKKFWTYHGIDLDAVIRKLQARYTASKLPH